MACGRHVILDKVCAFENFITILNMGRSKNIVAAQLFSLLSLHVLTLAIIYSKKYEYYLKNVLYKQGEIILNHWPFASWLYFLFFWFSFSFIFFYLFFLSFKINIYRIICFEGTGLWFMAHMAFNLAVI